MLDYTLAKVQRFIKGELNEVSVFDDEENSEYEEAIKLIRDAGITEAETYEWMDAGEVIIERMEPKGGKVMPTKNTDTKVVTGEVRFSYLHVFTPHSMDEDKEPRFSVCLLIPKTDTKTIAKIKKAIEAAKIAGKNKWGGKVPVNLKTPLRDGDTEQDDLGQLKKIERPELDGHYFLNCTSKTQPGLVNRQLNPILDSEELYSGCHGRASINFYSFSVNGNKGIACGLNNIQKLRDGEYLGGRSRAEDDFEAVEDDEDEELFG